MNSDGFWRPELDDPRWAAAPLAPLAYTAGSADINAAQYRLITHGDYVYVAVQVLTDDEGPDYQDSVYLGISAGSASRAYVQRIFFEPDPSVVTAPVDPDGTDGQAVPQDNPLPQPQEISGYVTHWISTSSGSFTDPSVTEQSGSLSFVDQIAVWRPADTPAAAGPPRKWALTMRIDKAVDGLNPSPGTIRLFIGTDVHLDAGGTPTTVSFANAAPAVSGVGGGIVPLATSAWPRFAEIGTACGPGSSIGELDIGVMLGQAGTDPSQAPSDRLCVTDPCPSTVAGGNPVNVLRAVIHNVDDSAGLAPWELRARFRLSDWASTETNREFGPWQDVSASPQGTAMFVGPDPTVAEGWHWQAVDDGNGTQTSDVIIDYECDPGSSPYCPEMSNLQNETQCLLVELAVPPGSGRQLATSAAVRCLSFGCEGITCGPGEICIAGECVEVDAGGNAGSDAAVSSEQSDASVLDGSLSPLFDGGFSRSDAAGPVAAPDGSAGTSLDSGTLSPSGTQDAGSLAQPNDGGNCGCRVVGVGAGKSSVLPLMALVLCAFDRRRASKNRYGLGHGGLRLGG
jgi:hypothetical protein